MSTKLWIGNKMHIVDEAVREYVEELEGVVDALLEADRAIASTGNISGPYRRHMSSVIKDALLAKGGE